MAEASNFFMAASSEDGAAAEAAAAAAAGEYQIQFMNLSLLLTTATNTEHQRVTHLCHE